MSNVATAASATTTANVEAPPLTATTPPAAMPTTPTVTMHMNGRSRAQYAIALVEKHPVKIIAAAAAAAALIEAELALGLLIGVGATLLLASRPGAEARRDVFETSQRIASRVRSAFAAPPQAVPPAPPAAFNAT